MAVPRPEAVSPSPTAAPAFELKGTTAPVTVLRLKAVDLEALDRELTARVESVPQLLHAPVVIDVGEVGAGALPLPLAAIVERVRRARLVPVGVANLRGEHAALATDVGLGLVHLGTNRPRAVAPAEPPARREPPAAPRPPEPAERPEESPVATLTIRHPVRGGQVIYAKGADLVVLGPVNSGAQVIADGHIHIYGPLRGRALAGAHGLAEARVFCQSLEAELVSIDGTFLTADGIPSGFRGRPAQVFIEGGEVRVAPL